ncbi:hypothetical protein MRB53_032693 [Persea americana]|uniref:Uncharacterized protein n=1 Tax=Persea americana TaxID=3435 RepID=A0ACC2KT58_PERAE|nr:hypothetical protein MRB53_032693 [Persea americana]
MEYSDACSVLNIMNGLSIGNPDKVTSNYCETESLSTQTVDEQVFPHVATGFPDTSAFLRELTLKSMLVLAPKQAKSWMKQLLAITCLSLAQLEGFNSLDSGLLRLLLQWPYL